MDLSEMFGGRYVVSRDDSWAAETSENRGEFRAKGEGWWYWKVRGQRGTVYPFNATNLAVDVTSRRARQLEALLGPALTLHARCDEVVTYKADVRHLEAILRFIRPKRRRQLTTEQKGTLAARLAPYRFQGSKAIAGKSTSLLSPTSSFEHVGPMTVLSKLNEQKVERPGIF